MADWPVAATSVHRYHHPTPSPAPLLATIIDLFLHLDTHLAAVIAQYGALTYALLFLIIFVETGVVVMPFLPGDSLLFAAGAFAARGDLHIAALFVLLAAAAVLGDGLNYFIGRSLGPRVFTEKRKWLRADYLEKTKKFYEKYGKKAIVLARFMPIIRTFAPFVAGIGAMEYGTFVAYNVIGGVVWVGLFLGTGFFFGNIPAVEKNFTYVIFVIIILSVLPPIVEFLKEWRHRSKA